jgi:predicted ATPase
MTVRRIAVTGGPGAGKTTLWRALAAQHPKELVAVPEVATLMFQHVFPQVRDATERKAVQRAIFAVQKELEAFYEQRMQPGQLLLCDRGTPDGGGYWPSDEPMPLRARRPSTVAELCSPYQGRARGAGLSA